MVKISQGDIFGRMGSSFGESLNKSLSEEMPKETERTRRALGLKELSAKKGLTPEQQMSELLSIPGMTTQGIQSMGDLLRQKGIREGFGTPRETIQGQPGEQAGHIQGGALQRQQQNRANNFTPQELQEIQQQSIPSGYQNREQEAQSQQGIARENLAQEKFIPARTWTPEEKADEISRLWSRHPSFSFEQISSLANENEKRIIQQPEDYRKQQEYLKGLEDQASTEFDNQLSTILQKELPREGGIEGAPIYRDVTGQNILNAKKAMYNDIATNPGLNTRKAAEKWSKKLKDFAESKNEDKVNANRDLFDKILPHRKEEILKRLKTSQKIYNDLGEKREFYNMLRTNNNPIEGITGYGLSPGYAALIAYPRSENVKQITNTNQFRTEADRKNSIPISKNIAAQYLEKRTGNDSIQAFVREFKDKNPFFSERAFLDYIRDNQDKYNLTPDELKDLQTGVPDYFSTWGDITLFPGGGGSKAHD